jgi:AcrR family transcriptional regulator
LARPRNPVIRTRLRSEAVDYVLSHGVADLSLRPLAKALKTNARMLVYHFGSREGLMREILVGLREREDARIQSWFKTGRQPRTLPQFIRWYWKRLSTLRAKPAICLIYELYALALRTPQDYPGILEDPLAYWHKLTKKLGFRRIWILSQQHCFSPQHAAFSWTLAQQGIVRELGKPWRHWLGFSSQASRRPRSG